MRKQAFFSWVVRGFFLVSLFATSIVVGSDNFRVISSPEDLRDLLRETQWLLLPQGFPVEIDAGEFFFLPDNLASERFISAFAVDAEGKNPVFVSEDAETHETVFLDAGGNCIEALAPGSGYTPLWVVDLLAPEGLPDGEQPEDYDPARVSLAVKLLPVCNAPSNAPAASSSLFRERRAILKNRVLLHAGKQVPAMQGVEPLNARAASLSGNGNTVFRAGAIPVGGNGSGISIFYTYDTDDRLTDTAIGDTGAGVTETLTPAGNAVIQDERGGQ